MHVRKTETRTKYGWTDTIIQFTIIKVLKQWKAFTLGHYFYKSLLKSINKTACFPFWHWNYHSIIKNINIKSAICRGHPTLNLIMINKERNEKWWMPVYNLLATSS